MSVNPWAAAKYWRGSRRSPKLNRSCTIPCYCVIQNDCRRVDLEQERVGKWGLKVGCFCYLIGEVYN